MVMWKKVLQSRLWKNISTKTDFLLHRLRLLTEEQTADVVFTAACLAGLCMILFDLTMGIAFKSLIWVSSGVHRTGALACRFVYLRGKMKPPDQQLKYYRHIAGLLAAAAYEFNVCMVIRQIFTKSVTVYPAFLTVVYSIYVIFSYISVVLGIKKEKLKNDTLSVGIRIVNLSSCVVNLVLVQRMILSEINLSDSVRVCVNSVFGYFCGGILFIMAISMLIHYCFLKRQASTSNV